ncbi:hypothetical protein G9A89_017067 [Geosiphon pyriformis]|nr:hypothetical protein G9A89_017067 [Geosiphon pyriformis]
MGNIISVITETKLKGKVCPWIMNKFDGIRVFTFDLKSGYLGAGVTIIMDASLAKHVCKVSEVSGQLISVKLLFKNKLLLTVLGLYAGATLEKKLVYSHVINSMVAETLNGSTFIVLGGNFNENNSGHNASFKKCLNLVVLMMKFRDASLAAFLKSAGDFEYHTTEGNINEMWTLLCQMVCSAAEATLMKTQSRDNGSRKFLEFKTIEDSQIWAVIDKHMEAFADNKGQIIRSVLEKPFRKVMLDHLVNNGDLVLELDLVKGKVNLIMKNWTRKCAVKPSMPSCWQIQFSSLDHVSDSVFSGVMKQINFDEFSLVVKDLLNGKAAGLFGISNEMWKHCDKSVLVFFLHLLNLCLWKEVLTNTRLIAFIETSRKILLKILSDRISRAYNIYNVLHKNNFLVFKDTSTQSHIFVVGSVVENVLEKDRELWLVLQNMYKAYDSRIKMCEKFVRFFGSIHNGHKNRVMTDFGLSKSYKIHDGLDQREVFSPLLWRIFYDPLLCKVKKHESFFGYWVNSKFVVRTSRIELNAGLTSYLAAGAFVNNTIWVGNCYTATQNILNIANEFFELMDISINIEKTVVIPINPKTSNTSLKSGGLVKNFSSAFEFPSKLDVSDMDHFGFVCSSLKDAFLPIISIYTDGSVKDFGTSNAVKGAAAYFSDLGLHIGVEVHGMLSSTLAEIQAVVLAFKCIPASSNVTVFSDS